MALIKEPIVLPHNILKDPMLEWFVAQCHKRRYATKTTIIFAGDKPETLYFIIKGSVTVLIEDDDGKELVLAYLNSGDFFGEMGLFDGENNRSAWVRAKVETDLAEISYSRFQSLSK
ncbi:MAG: transcriptional regulator Crp, partial [Gammaproteobacteria bacterium]